jgi:hypothetical protein
MFSETSIEHAMNARDLLGLENICDKIRVRFVDGSLWVLPVELFGFKVIP